jgi:hypothetical protein
MAIAHPAAAAPRERARAVEAAPGSAAISVLGLFSLVGGAVVLYALWEFWPTQTVLKANATATPVRVFGITRNLQPDVRLLVVVALAGLLGALMHSTRSLAWYIGHRGLVWRWIPFYLVTVLIGAGLASIFYLVLRGGVFNSNTQPSEANPYGFAALGALVGLFTEQALEMLKRVANQVFAVPPVGADTVTASGSGDTAAAQALLAKTLPASNIAATSATLTGNVTPAPTQTQWYFDWGTTTGYGEATPAQSIDSAAGATGITADINGLTAATEYHFRLVAADSGGDWTTGDDMIFTTLAE